MACGSVDDYYQRNMKPWYYAAGAIIAAESGARVEPPSEQNGHLMVAASRHIFEPLRQLLS